MAATVAASKTYDLTSGALREDLEDIIYDISPMDTVFLTKAARGTAKSTLHEWLVDTLVDATSRNIAVEGDAFTAVARALPSRLKNYTQISRKDFEVTGTAQATTNAGMRELMAYHTARAGKELKRDIEKAALSNNFGTAGLSTVGRTSAGVENWCYLSNHIKLTIQTAATTAIPSSGFAQQVTDGTSTAFVEADLKNMLARSWETGGEVDTILAGSSLYNTISGFTGIATRFRDVASRQQAQIIGYADVYVSFSGSHNIVVSRYARTTTVLALDMSTWSVNYLRPFQTVEIAKIGDAERRTILAEWTLVAKSPTANTKVTSAT